MTDKARLLDEERRFFARRAYITIAVILLGFTPSFYLRGIVPAIRPLHPIDPLVLLHGLAFSAWLVLYATQALLVRRGAIATHRKLGIAGFCLACILPVLGMLVALGQVHKHTQPPFSTPEQWQAIALIDVPVMVALLVLGWRNRHRPDAHKRLMTLFSMKLAEPALGRLVLWPRGPVANGIASGLVVALMIPVILWDLKKLGHLHWTTRLVLILTACEFAVRYGIWRTDAWAALVRGLCHALGFAV